MPLKVQSSLQNGFSLIEALVALIVISIGLLGNASMQALMINNTAIARNRSLAALESEALATMMHANVGYWEDIAYLSSFTIIGSTLGNTSLNNLTNDCVSTACTAIQMAAYDLKQWGPLVANLLPAGTGNVACSAAAANPVSCVITVSWSETNLKLNQAGESVTQSYTLVVQP